MPPSNRASATRRAALGGALVGVASLAGCDREPTEPAPAPRVPVRDQTDPDAAIVAAARAELDGLTALLAAAVEARRALAPRLNDLRRLHRAHRQVLGGDASGRGGRRRVRGTAEEVLTIVDRAERRAQRRFAQAAVEAQSGPLARLLASMSAAIAQQVPQPR